jgi:hypothetical protein
MVIPSLIYFVVTILLAFVDYLRIKAEKGKEENINHGVSVALAMFLGMFTLAFANMKVITSAKIGFILFGLISISFVAVRLLVYDVALNLMRHLPIDYVSTATSSYEDQHSEKVKFWQKRLIGAVGWGMVLITYHAIFKTW